MATFAETFCRTHGVPRERFARALFWRCLHRRALLVAPVVLLLNPQYFSPDFELLNGVGRLTDFQRLDGELRDYYSHPWNLGFMRRRLRLRLSGRRLIHHVRRGLPPPGPDSREA